jgi:hypothetical protein
MKRNRIADELEACRHADADWIAQGVQHAFLNLQNAPKPLSWQHEQLASRTKQRRLRWVRDVWTGGWRWMNVSDK